MEKQDLIYLIDLMEAFLEGEKEELNCYTPEDRADESNKDEILGHVNYIAMYDRILAHLRDEFNKLLPL